MTLTGYGVYAIATYCLFLDYPEDIKIHVPFVFFGFN